MEPTKQRVWDRLYQAKIVLKDTSKGEQFSSELQNVKSFLYPGDSTENNAVANADQREFMASQYVSFLEFLVEQFSVEWIQCLSTADLAGLVDVFFLHGCHTDSFMVLCNAVKNTSPGFRLNKVVALLETLLQGNGLKDLLLAQCDTKSVVPIADLVTYLVTVPDRVINKLQTQAGALFFPAEYVRVLCGALLSTLRAVHARLVAGHSSKLDFLSLLVGKLALHGHADAMWRHLLPHVVPLAHQQPVWARVCERLVTGIPARFITAAVSSLVHQIPWYGYMSYFLGNAALSNSKLRFLLTNKLFLHSYTDQDVVLQNVIGYLTSSGTLRPLYFKVLRDVLEVWGDGAVLKHAPYEQHLYLSRALMVCVAFMGPQELSHCKQQGDPPLMTVLLSGMQCHLDSGQAGVRAQGMMVAEALTALLESSLEEKLTFEYEETDEVRRLKSLMMKPADPGIDVLESEVESLSLDDENKGEEQSTGREETKEEEELDSDDDLEPYDMSHDQKKTEQKTPLYLRDCMEGLISSEDPVYLDVCLQAAERLVRQHPDHAREMSVELLKVMLHLSHHHSPELRLSAMLALTVTDPKATALYLGAQLYERNYNISHRVEILQVLASAAQELSSPKPKTPTPNAPTPPPSSQPSPALSPSPGWREIVQQRIDSKTRWISKRRPAPPASANRFAPVAGCFFFPLLCKFDQKQGWLDLFGADHFVLTRLTYTLGVVMRAATNAPVVPKMAPALMEFILCVRYHTQAAVRQAVLFATCMLLLAVPSYSLLNQHSTELAEIKQWLQSVYEEDTDPECRKLSIEALMLIKKAVEQEFHTET